MTSPPRAVPLLAAAGLVASALAAVAAGRAYTGTSVPPTRWWGLIAALGHVAGDSPVWAVLLWVGITALSVSWVVAIRLSRRGALTERQGWTMAGLWALPLALGPPAVSRDVYAYAAQSVLLHGGSNIYRDGPTALANVPGADAARALASVDPRWRDNPSPYGPATAAVQWLAGVTGSPTFAVIVLRVVAVLAVAALAWLCVSLAAGRRVEVLVLVALNPLVLIHALSAAHVEALMCALLVASLVAARREAWWLAAVLASLAGLVKAPAFLAVVVLLGWHALDGTNRLRRLAPDVAAALGTVVVVSFAVPDGWGWLRNLSTPGQGDPTSSVTGHLASLAHAISPTAKTIVTGLGVLAAVAILAALAWTFRRRPPAVSLGWGLLAVAFLAPVAYPWYALWGLVCLLPHVRGRPLTVLIGLCVVEAGLSIPGASGSVTGPLVLTVLVLTVAGVVATLRKQPRNQPPNDGGRRSTNDATPSRPSGLSAQRAIDSAS